MGSLLQAISGLFASAAFDATAWGFGVSFVLCVLLVITKRWHGALTMDFTSGVQKFHTAPTPRVGGVPIVLGLIVAWGKSPADVQALLGPIIFAGMPAFMFGVAEDITKKVGVIQRLMATMASGLLAWWITDYSLTRIDVWGVDLLLKFTFVSVVFTAFAVGGVANAINIIDGFNGLASTMAALAFICFGMIAWQVGDSALANVALILAACVWGFFWVNWPFGKLFLGDGGSYFIGFALAWLAVLLIERNLNISTFAALLICIHPVTEVLFSMYRRKVRKEHPGMPDRLHFHSLVKRRIVSKWLGQSSANVRNSITGIMVGLMSFVPVVSASLVYKSPILSICACGVFVLVYIAIYARIVKHYWCSPIYFLVTSQMAKKKKVDFLNL
jgi:UDP-N-acetylmuramyl pentapeptide phosphotransferase/UDP-N-acetylglucosamine-1-phosphate transferase